jgi:sugar transferase (PEP-CTERM/EpsH1 system associated)
MRVLVVCHRFPYPPKRGGKIRPFNVVRHLAARHDVHVLSLARSAQESAEGAGIASCGASFDMVTLKAPAQFARMIARLPTLTPSSFGYFHSPSLARLVRGALSRTRFDLIFVHCSSVARYVEHVDDVPKILDFGDMDSQKWVEYGVYKPFPLSLGYAMEGWKLEREERRLARRFDVCTATTRSEWRTLQSFAGDTPTDWFPNGVDSDYFAPSEDAYDPDTVAFVGRMDYFPNQQCMFEFCRHTLPLLKARNPAQKLVIIGADPSSGVRALGSIPGVTVTGSVPDVRPLLRRAAVSIAPLTIARGTQNKILEAMSLGVPVVTSPIAAGGVDAIAGEHFVVAATPAECASAIERISRDPSERRRLALAGRARMLSHHAWDKSMQRFDAIAERCVADFANRRAYAARERRAVA